MKFFKNQSNLKKLYLTIPFLLVSENAFSIGFCSKESIDVSFSVDYGKPKYIDISSGGLKKQTAKIVSNHKNPRGLTEASFSEKMDISFSLSQFGNQVCVYPKAVKVYMGYPSLNVYLDNKYNKNTCEYDTVLGHENQHVEIYQMGLKKFSKTISKRMYDIITNVEPMRDTVSSSNDLSSNQWKVYTKRFNRDIGNLIENDKELQKYKNQMDAYIKRYNAALDTEENYNKTQLRCKNW